MQRCYAEHNELCPYYLEDFYPLTNTENFISNKIWLAYQLYRPSDETGYILAFRRPECEEKQCTVKLYGLNPRHEYKIINKDTDEVIEKTGKDLMDGIVLTLDNSGSSLLLQIVRNNSRGK